MKKTITLIILFLMSVMSMANGNGGYAGSYLRMGLGARAQSMGNTGIAGDVNAYSSYYNPAAFGFIEDKLVGLSHGFLSMDRRVNFISFSMKVPPAAGFSISWIESGFSNVYSYNTIGQNTGEINQSANAVYFSFGRKIIDNLSVGISLKILFEFINDGTDEFDYSSNGVGFDFGVLYRIREDLSLAYQLKDVKSQLKAQTDKIFDRGGTTIDPFPLINKVGAFYQTPLGWLNAAYEFEWSNKDSKKHHIGLEAVHGKNLALRLGFNGDVLTFGAGMDFNLLDIESFVDYAFLPSVVDEGSSHVFSWQLAL